jgi:kynurenine formamidase
VALIDLSHAIHDGLVTYQGLPPVQICDYLTREASRERYTGGGEFQIGRIDMVANTGTYVDVPFHRFADGDDLDRVALDRLAELPAICVDIDELPALRKRSLRGMAVLVRTGWSRHFGTPAYFRDHPFVPTAEALALRDAGVALVGIDSHNIDDTATRNERPVHTALLGAGIPICEHMRGLEQLPSDGFVFTAAPPRVVGMGTFAVRAFARL